MIQGGIIHDRKMPPEPVSLTGFCFEWFDLMNTNDTKFLHFLSILILLISIYPILLHLSFLDLFLE